MKPQEELNPITYAELAAQIMAMPQDQQDKYVTIYDSIFEEFIPATLDITESGLEKITPGMAVIRATEKTLTEMQMEEERAAYFADEGPHGRNQ